MDFRKFHIRNYFLLSLPHVLGEGDPFPEENLALVAGAEKKSATILSRQSRGGESMH